MKEMLSLNWPVFVLICGSLLVKCQENDDSPVKQAFTKNQVVPDVVDEAPNAAIEVLYKNGLKVDLGNELTPSQVREPPTTITFPAENGVLYTLCMTDPDAPSRQNPKLREFLHWLVINIPGNEVKKGTTIAEYKGSGPPKGTGLHRYIFVAYKQPNGLIKGDDEKLTGLAQNRKNFKIQDFANKYNLGNPVAGNFFQAQFEEPSGA